MSREEHLNWCKQRAMEYADTGDLQNAVVSMLSDLRKHPETKSCLEWANPMGLGVLMNKNKDKRRVVEFIQGFN